MVTAPPPLFHSRLGPGNFRSRISRVVGISALPLAYSSIESYLPCQRFYGSETTIYVCVAMSKDYSVANIQKSQCR
ncbi:hypothetical protein EMIT0P176_30286 [Pseudomonas sp. IT-P176]